MSSSAELGNKLLSGATTLVLSGAKFSTELTKLHAKSTMSSQRSYMRSLSSYLREAK